MAILEETGLATRPDVVVLGFYLNDLNESYGFSVGQLPGWLDRSYLAWLAVRSVNILKVEMEVRRSDREHMRNLFDEIARQFPPEEGDPRGSRGAFYREALLHIYDWGASFSASHWTYMEPLFQRFRRLADRHGFQPLIAIFPVRLQIEADFVEDYPQRQLKRIAHRATRQPLLHDHCYYTVHGGGIIAEEMLAFIQDEYAIHPYGAIPEHLGRSAPQHLRSHHRQGAR